MRKIWDFQGGIHPPDNKRQSTRVRIQPAPLPAQLWLPLGQHLGQPARPVVEVGQPVLKGQLLAEAEGRISARLHAPTSGTVTALERRPVPHPSGMEDWCLVLETDGKDRWIELDPVPDPDRADAATLLAAIHAGGLCGLGGAGFPTEVKLQPGQRQIETLILNAAECEPYITADDALLRERADEVLSGLRLMARILQPQQCLIGIEDNKPEAIAALRHALQAPSATMTSAAIELVVIPTKYPSGGEKQLIRILTGREVPHGQLPADIGVVCHNVGTAAAVHRAIVRGEPLISRITTVTGAAVRQPGNYDVLIGTPIQHLMAAAGLDEARLHRLVMGGPMMGFTLTSHRVPVIKTTNCLLAADASEFPDPPDEQPCIRCGFCANACPAQLLPQQLFWFSKAGDFEKAELYHLDDCIECGACAYVCPSHIPLVQYYRYAKGEIRQMRDDQAKSDRARERFEARKHRLEREQAEKEARRKARAEAAAAAQAAAAGKAGTANSGETER